MSGLFLVSKFIHMNPSDSTDSSPNLFCLKFPKFCDSWSFDSSSLIIRFFRYSCPVLFDGFLIILLLIEVISLLYSLVFCLSKMMLYYNCGTALELAFDIVVWFMIWELSYPENTALPWSIDLKPSFRGFLPFKGDTIYCRAGPFVAN